MNKVLVIIGTVLILASATIFASQNFTTQRTYPPVVSSESGQATTVNYVAFFGFAFGGAGFLILLFSFFQWYGKRRSK